MKKGYLDRWWGNLTDLNVKREERKSPTVLLVTG